MDLERVFVGVGANLGDARRTVTQALAELAGLPGTQVVARSSLYRSAPVDAPGPHFVNAVAELRTTLEPQALLQAMHGIEQAHGRVRAVRNAPRTLDMDLLLYGQRVVDSPALRLPHPRGHLRAFVLLPLAELAPQLLFPGHRSAAELAAALTGQPIEKLP